ncbi:MAG: histidine kinase [Pedobacter sp.]|nr:MAG: histidine kinase [Pedobacter sp.]
MSRNSFLRAQINPHLLFNTFEFLHNKMKTIAPEDAKLMVYLSEIVRFAAATDFNDGLVKLGDEILQCKNLISIYNVTQQKAFIKISSSENVTKLKFIPLVVITLLENILKHGDISDNEKFSGIDVYIESGRLKIESFNFPSSDKVSHGFGAGLENIRTRLFYAYGNSFTMATQSEEGIFRVEVSVPLEMLSLQ